MNPAEDKPVLVIGATGFVGAGVCRELAAAGLPVVGTSTDGTGADHACDIRRPEAVDRTLREVRPETVVLAAGIASLATAWREPAAAYLTNTAGVFHVLDGLRRLAPSAHMVFTSSASVYGAPESPDELPFTETTPVRPASPYAASKAAAEVLCRQFIRQYGLDVTIARIFNQIGPGLNDDQAPAEFAREIAAAEKRGLPKLELPVGNPTAGRDFNDVRDTARAIAGLVESRATGTFNICSGVGVELGRIVELLALSSPVEVTVKVDPDHERRADIPLVRGSAERLRTATGWRPRIPLEQSLIDLLADWRTRV